VAEHEVAAAKVLRHLEDSTSAELASVAHEQLRVVAERVLIGLEWGLHEAEGEHRAEASDRRRDGCAPCHLQQSGSHPLPEPEHVLVDLAILQQLDAREGGRHPRQIAVAGAGEPDVPAVRGAEALHVPSAARDRGNRKSVAKCLAERGEVGSDARDRLVAAEVVPEARDHLVEDQ
jgi:hypothetical protein